MAKHILNSAFHILNQPFPCCWLVIPLLVLYWSVDINNTHPEGV
jgi:hypothetical protein